MRIARLGNGAKAAHIIGTLLMLGDVELPSIADEVGRGRMTPQLNPKAITDKSMLKMLLRCKRRRSCKRKGWRKHA